jgi:hypothetical protein
MPTAAPRPAAALAALAVGARAPAAVALLALAVLTPAAPAPAAAAPAWRHVAPAAAAAAWRSAAPAAAAAAWRLPVRGEVVGGFAYDERRPFAAGSRRGVDIAAAPGAAVWAACSGRVSHAGWVPQWGLGVSVRCGRLTATHLGLGALAVRRGGRVRRGDGVRRGQWIGHAGPAGVVRLGARVTARRFGWVDPLRLTDRSPPPAAGPPIPAGPPPRTRVPPPRARVPPRPVPARSRPAASRAGPAQPAVPAAHRGIPAPAWLGAALLAAGLPLGGMLSLRRARARRAPRPRPAPARPRG